MKKMIFAIAVMAAGAAMAVTIAYQGALKNADGSPISGGSSMPITFRLYDSPTEDNLLWARTVNVLLNGEGLFNVELSDTSGSNPAAGTLTATLESVLATYTDKLFIGLYVEGSTGEIRPRQKLLSVPMAAYAQDVSKAKKDFEVTGHAKINNGLEVIGNADISGSINVGGSLKVKGNIEGPDKSSLPVSCAIDLNGDAKLTKVVKLTAVSGSTVSIEEGAKLMQSGVVGGIVPKGGIIMWSGAVNAIPKGWALCNGQKVGDLTTPDLRDRFIVGAGSSYGVGATGGEEKHQLNVGEMPAHMHLYVAESQLNDRLGDNGDWGSNSLRYKIGKRHTTNIGSHPRFGYQWNIGSDQMTILETGVTGGDGTKSGNYLAEGHAASHENRPPYYALCFIIKL